MRKVIAKAMTLAMVSTLMTGVVGTTAAFADDFPSKQIEIEFADDVVLLEDMEGVRLNPFGGLWCDESLKGPINDYSSGWGADNATGTYATVENDGKYCVDLYYNEADYQDWTGVQVITYTEETIVATQTDAEEASDLLELLADADCTVISIKVNGFESGEIDITDATPSESEDEETGTDEDATTESGDAEEDTSNEEDSSTSDDESDAQTPTTDDKADEESEDDKATAAEATYKIHFYNSEGWEKVGLWLWSDDENTPALDASVQWPGLEMTKEEGSDKWFAYYYTGDLSALNFIVNNFLADGATQTQNLKMNAQGEYWVVLGDADENGQFAASVLGSVDEVEDLGITYDGKGLDEETIKDQANNSGGSGKPDTGDATTAIPYICLTLMSAAGLVYMKKRKFVF